MNRGGVVIIGKWGVIFVGKGDVIVILPNSVCCAAQAFADPPSSEMSSYTLEVPEKANSTAVAR